MENRRLAVVMAAATLDAFLARAIEELKNSACDRAEANRSPQSFEHQELFEK
jgi:hypothetical protein